MPTRCNINNMARMRKDKPRLRIVEPAEPAGEGAPPRKKRGRGPALANGLTAPQELFAQRVAAGESLSAAYRAAYNTENMKDATIWRRASELFDHGMVKARIDALLAERERDALHDARRAKEWGLKLLRDIAETAQTDGARVAAVQTVFRTHALLTDRVEQETHDERTTEQLRQELADALALLANPPRMRA